jgi:KaiC/GvpD/RAD55 family RecA-like ATPase
MENKHISKNILMAIQATVKATREQIIDEDLITKTDLIVKPIADFYKLNTTQAILFAFILDLGYRDIEIDQERLIEQFGADMSVMADINEALEELAERRLVYYMGRTRFKQKKIMKSIKINEMAISAMLAGDATTLGFKKIESFIQILDEVNELYKFRIRGLFSSAALVADVQALLNLNDNLPEIQWLLKQKKLSEYDMTILLGICIDHANGEVEVDFDETLKQVFEDVFDGIIYKRRMKDESCPLLTNQLIEFSYADFRFCNYVKLTSTAMDVLLGGYKGAIQSSFKPQMGTLIKHDLINEEKLYYNAIENEQIDTLVSAFSDANYKSLLGNLVNNNMRAGFTVLLHGFPGTGKTSSVMQIAKNTGRNIFMVDIEKIQSKWVGDSEKNLSNVFKEYKQCCQSFDKDPILLFNESDALLNKRINVNSSTDKMGNAMQNILLQELEDFDGIFIATTNLTNQLDAAFDRRFLYKIEFKEPEAEVRYHILSTAFPDFNENVLKKINNEFHLTGGQIANLKKKLLVKGLLDKKINRENYLLALGAEELSLSRKIKSRPIGFYNN